MLQDHAAYEEMKTMARPEQAEAESDLISVTINAIAQEADGILSFEFVKADGGDLPPFTAGAHIHVHIGDGLSRQYSLCNDPAETHRYVVAVLKEQAGRGGSTAMHEALKKGQQIKISSPVNHFELAGRGANFHLLLAGGIGVTPMMAMIEELERQEKPYLMHYCTRSPETTAFLDRLEPRIKAGKVIVHHDDGDPSKGLNLAETLAKHEIGMHLYACGPGGFMDAGEMPKDALARELMEEIAIEVEISRLLGIYPLISTSAIDGGIVIAYHARPLHRELPPLEHNDDVDAAGWFAVEDLPEPIAFRSSSELLSKWKGGQVPPNHGCEQNW